MSSGRVWAAAASARAARPNRARPARSWRRSSAIPGFFRATRSEQSGGLPISRQVRPFLQTKSCCSATRNCGRARRRRSARAAKIEWSPVWSLRDARFKHLPTSLLYFFYRGPAAFAADSNGCAAGNTLEEAIVQGFLELVERDAYAIWWYNRLQRPQLDLSQFDDSYVRDLRRQLAESGRKLWVLDVTSDLGVPTFVAVTHWMQNGRENIEFGSGAHFDTKIALLRALTELNQFLSLGLMGGGTGEKSSLDGATPLRLEDHPYLTPSGNPMVH